MMMCDVSFWRNNIFRGVLGLHGLNIQLARTLSSAGGLLPKSHNNNIMKIICAHP